jgi:hypothetical protein
MKVIDPQAVDEITTDNIVFINEQSEETQDYQLLSGNHISYLIAGDDGQVFDVVNNSDGAHDRAASLSLKYPGIRFLAIEKPMFGNRYTIGVYQTKSKGTLLKQPKTQWKGI